MKINYARLKSAWEAQKKGDSVSFTINLAKENFKFSGTHFTIFAANEAERMHGHNYQVALHIEIGNELDPKLGFAFDFNTVKPLIKGLCDQLDEYILIPEKSPYLKIEKNTENTVVTFAKKTYSLPNSDIRLLPIVNITVEELARYICQKLIQKWTDRPSGVRIRLTVEETKGQSVTYQEDFA